MALNTPWGRTPAHESRGFFFSSLGRECDGYNTREGKKSAVLQRCLAPGRQSATWQIAKHYLEIAMHKQSALASQHASIIPLNAALQLAALTTIVQCEAQSRERIVVDIERAADALERARRRAAGINADFELPQAYALA